jgi:hypothetical protein
MAQTPARAKKPSRRRRAPATTRWRWPLAEVLCLVGAAWIGVVAVLGRTAAALPPGIGVWASVSIFAGVVLGLALAGAAGVWSWLVARAWLGRWRAWVPALLAVGVAVGAAWFASRPEFEGDLGRLRALLGGRAEAERQAIAHQVFAAYRRTPPEAWTRLLERGREFEPVVHEAAAAFAVDPEVLTGVR